MEIRAFREYWKTIKDKNVFVYLKNGTLLKGKIDLVDDDGFIIDKTSSNTFVFIDSVISVKEKEPERFNNSFDDRFNKK